jgi:3-oxoacyl-[acyl-carrier protein] reductase
MSSRPFPTARFAQEPFNRYLVPEMEARMELGLKDKVVLIAASSEGLGYATAKALVSEGARVWIGSRDLSKVAGALVKLRKEPGAAASGGIADGGALDVSDKASIDAWVGGAAAAYGRSFDALVVNSGGPPPGRFTDFDDTAWQKAFELLVLSAVRVIRSSLPGLSERGGSILVCSSTSVREPIDGLILSNSLRSATVAMAKTLSLELAPKGIRVNCLAPGRFGTGRVDRLDQANADRTGTTLEEARSRATAAIAMGRYGDPDEFGKAACWMLSAAASYMTGQIVTLDGGQVKGTW